MPETDGRTDINRSSGE